MKIIEIIKADKKPTAVPVITSPSQWTPQKTLETAIRQDNIIKIGARLKLKKKREKEIPKIIETWRDGKEGFLGIFINTFTPLNSAGLFLL